MIQFALPAAASVVLWAALVVGAQMVNPDQSPLALGMSGLARGRSPWLMKSAFVVRGLSALLLVAALPAVVAVAGSALAGIPLFWLWGAGSAALALADTDMPGETPTRAGKAHVLIAMAAYLAGVTGALLVSFALGGDQATAGIAHWALPLAAVAALAMVVQFVAFGAAAREARASAASASAPASAPSAGSAASVAAAPPPLSGAAPQLRTAAGPVAVARSSALQGLAGYAGLFQRIFVGLLMAWTLLVALGVASR